MERETMYVTGNMIREWRALTKDRPVWSIRGYYIPREVVRRFSEAARMHRIAGVKGLRTHGPKGKLTIDPEQGVCEFRTLSGAILTTPVYVRIGAAARGE